MATYLRLCLLAASSSSTIAQDAHQNTIFVFNHFNTTSTIKYFADASLQSNAICLTNHPERVIGRAYFDKAVPVKGNGSVISFSTSFIFAMVPHPRSGGGNGLCFIMTPTTALNGAIANQYFGLVNFSSDGKDYNHLFAVEFDTIESVGVEDKDSNHVGIDLKRRQIGGGTTCWNLEGNSLTPINLKSGHNIRAWIGYDGESKKLEISIAAVGEARPEKALLSKKELDLDGIMQDQMYVGFSASTGDLYLSPAT